MVTQYGSAQCEYEAASLRAAFLLWGRMIETFDDRDF
jgi:hypothetical protein